MEVANNSRPLLLRISISKTIPDTFDGKAFLTSTNFVSGNVEEMSDEKEWFQKNFWVLKQFYPQERFSAKRYFDAQSSLYFFQQFSDENNFDLSKKNKSENGVERSTRV